MEEDQARADPEVLEDPEGRAVLEARAAPLPEEALDRRLRRREADEAGAAAAAVSCHLY